MCKFCENLIDKNKDLILDVRGTFADDNICDFVNGDNCSKCMKCDMLFRLSGYKGDKTVYMSVEYNQTIVSSDDEEVIIRPLSESIPINFCPICGKQLSEDLIDFDRLGYLHIQEE